MNIVHHLIESISLRRTPFPPRLLSLSLSFSPSLSLSLFLSFSLIPALQSTLPFLSVAILVEAAKTVLDTLILDESKLGVRSSTLVLLALLAPRRRWARVVHWVISLLRAVMGGAKWRQHGVVRVVRDMATRLGRVAAPVGVARVVLEYAASAAAWNMLQKRVGANLLALASLHCYLLPIWGIRTWLRWSFFEFVD